jgi:plastocyanin
MRRALALVGIAMLAGATFALGAAAPAGATVTSVSITEYQFAPVVVSINVGDTVTWTNNGTIQHTVTADSGAFDAGSLDPGQTFSHTFDTPGSYAYYCQFHGGPGGSGMSGTVVVRAATTTVPATTPSSVPGTTAGPGTTHVDIAVATSTAAAAGPQLASTGSRSLEPALLALALIGLGTLCVGLARSRIDRSRHRV